MLPGGDSTQVITDALGSEGVTVLRNRAVRFDRDGGGLLVEIRVPTRSERSTRRQTPRA